MASLRLDTLPKELVAHIACLSEPTTVLNLSLTCRTIRAACYDSLIFKHILISNQRNSWKNHTLDLDSVTSRAGKDVQTWARYALADELATELANEALLSETTQNYINYLPELMAIKHPLMYVKIWEDVLQRFLDQKSNQAFCLAMAILTSEHDLRPTTQMENRLVQGSKMGAFLWAFCTMAMTLRWNLRIRLAAWPYNNSANVPHIPFPRAYQIPLRPLNDNYSLPLPFSRKAIELLGNSTSSFSFWDSWYDQHNAATAKDLSFFTQGMWCGYYMHFGVQAQWLDPPMVHIYFRKKDATLSDVWNPFDRESVQLEAVNCVDGINRFDLTGELSIRGREVEFIGRKQYQSIPTGWDWECRLTPFGLVGFWGHRDGWFGRWSRYGIVWLWKREWTEGT